MQGELVSLNYEVQTLECNLLKQYYLIHQATINNEIANVEWGRRIMSGISEYLQRIEVIREGSPIQLLLNIIDDMQEEFGNIKHDILGRYGTPFRENHCLINEVISDIRNNPLLETNNPTYNPQE